MTGGKRKQYYRDDGDQPDQAKSECGIRALVNLPADSYLKCLAADYPEDAPEQEQLKITMP